MNYSPGSIACTAAIIIILGLLTAWACLELR